MSELVKYMICQIQLLEHLKKMNALEGEGIDYPIMFCIYLGMFLFCVLVNIILFFSNNGRRVIWLEDQHKVIKSKFSYMAMLACTFTGVYLVGSFPSELQNTYGTWNADFFYTLGQTSIMLTAGIYSLATYKKRKSIILNSLSIIIGLSTSIPMAASTILLPLNLENNLFKLSAIIGLISLFIILAAVSVKFDLLVKYSRINIYLFILTTIALFSTINIEPSEMLDSSKILPFQGMLHERPWLELLENPYWWYFESTVVAWSVFCGRFVAYCSNGYSIRQVIEYGTFSLIVLTVIWHLVSAATGYTLSFSRGKIIYVLTAITMLAFAVTSLDSASKTLLNDTSRITKSRDLNIKSDVILFLIMVVIGVINIMVLYTGSSKLFTIFFSLVFIPYLICAIIYSFKFALGKIDYSESGTITEKKYIELSGKEPDEEDFRRII